MITLDELIAAREDGDAQSLDRFLLPIGVALGRPAGDRGRARRDAARVRRGQSVLIRGRDAPAFAGPGARHLRRRKPCHRRDRRGRASTRERVFNPIER